MTLLGFESFGIATDHTQIRALSPAEAQNAASFFLEQQKYDYSAIAYQSLMNVRRGPAEKPLDERFADFKVRLEAMLQRHPHARLK